MSNERKRVIYKVTNYMFMCADLLFYVHHFAGQASATSLCSRTLRLTRVMRRPISPQACICAPSKSPRLSTSSGRFMSMALSLSGTMLIRSATFSSSVQGVRAKPSPKMILSCTCLDHRGILYVDSVHIEIQLVEICAMHG